MPSRIEKLEAHAGHLLDGFIGLREKYAILEPMLFDPEVGGRRGAGPQRAGFQILRNALFLSCVQDIAKLALDSDPRTPSIRNLVAFLDDPAVLSELEARYSTWVVPSIEDVEDPEIAAALRGLEQTERAGRKAEFERHVREIRERWRDLSTAPAMDGFLTVRDKVSAHTEVRLVADKYCLIDIGALGIHWRDLRLSIEAMQRLVELLGFVIRNAGFAWDSLDDRLSRDVRAFW